jgi:hypothetical protein
MREERNHLRPANWCDQLRPIRNRERRAAHQPVDNGSKPVLRIDEQHGLGEQPTHLSHRASRLLGPSSAVAHYARKAR